MSPRRIHDFFAHELLPQLALDPQVDLYAEAEAEDLGPRFMALWDAMNERVPAHEAIDPEGLAVYVVMVDRVNGLLVTLPEATQEAEARNAMLVVGGKPEDRRYFTSEVVTDPAAPDQASELFVWESMADGLRRVSLGRRPDPSVDAFVTDVVDAVDAVAP